MNPHFTYYTMWPPFFHKEREHLGIDIGTTSIKIVKIVKVSSSPSSNGEEVKGTLVNYGILQAYAYLERHPSEVIQKEGVALVESEVVTMLQALLTGIHAEKEAVVLSIPAFSSFVDEITLPQMPESEVDGAIAFEARSHVPIPIADVELTWQVTDEGPKGKTVTILAVPKEVIFRYQSICDQLNLTLKALEVETFSTIRALNLYGADPVVLLDIGARNTNISLVCKGFLLKSHNVETAGRDLTRVIAQGLGVPLRRAEELKREQGLLVSRANPSLDRLVYPVIDNIAEAVNRVIESGPMREKVRRAILTGGSAMVKGFGEYLEERIKIPLEIAYPWKTIQYDQKLEPALRVNAPYFTVAVGLGLY